MRSPHTALRTPLKRQARKFVSPEWRRVLRAYATGEISRSVAMERLGLTWYGELKDAMAQAGIEVAVDRAREAQQIALAVQLLSDQVRPCAVRKMRLIRS